MQPERSRFGVTGLYISTGFGAAEVEAFESASNCWGFVLNIHNRPHKA